MRKVRAAAAVAAMVVGLGTVGAGTAFAGGGPELDQENKAACEVAATSNHQSLIGDVNVLSGIAVALLGDAEGGDASDRSTNAECEQEQENSID